jgi:hypothetical protein
MWIGGAAKRTYEGADAHRKTRHRRFCGDDSIMTQFVLDPTQRRTNAVRHAAAVTAGGSPGREIAGASWPAASVAEVYLIMDVIYGRAI